MNAIETSVKAWKCEKCKQVYYHEHQADKCCEDKKCVDCECSLPSNWYSNKCTLCNEKAQFGKATKLTWEEYQEQYPGNMVVLNDDRYFPDIYEAMEYWEDSFYPNPIDEDERPHYVWGTNKECMRIDGDWTIEQATEDTYEDAQFSDKAVAEFQNFVDEWNKKYSEDYYSYNGKVAVIIPWEEWYKNKTISCPKLT